MKITDKEALRQLKIVKCGELEEMLDTYPENERDGRSDLQMVADEAGYLYSLFAEEGTGHWDALEDARQIMRETENGKATLLDVKTLRPIYQKHDIEYARKLINEHRRLARLINRMAKMGAFSRWL